ncbi:hypothetical protein PZH42_29280, partial [Bacteroides cellulosilyticus]
MSFPALGTKNTPFKIFQDKDDQYWILTWGDGIYRFHPDATEKEKLYCYCRLFFCWLLFRGYYWCASLMV